MALACDMRVMASNAIMTTAFARVGFSGDYGGTFFMSQLIGTAKARQLYFMLYILYCMQHAALPTWRKRRGSCSARNYC